MTSKRQVFIYGLVGLVLAVAAGLQACIGLSRVNEASANLTADRTNYVSFRVSTALSTPAGGAMGPDAAVVPLSVSKAGVNADSPIRTPTFTPSPTRTPTPTLTPALTETPPPTATPPPPATLWPTATPQPQPTPIATEAALRVPILMYHYLSTPPPDADAIRRDLSVSPAQFEAQLAYLRQAGYETISLRDLTYALSQGTALPPKPIIITFDDGYRDNYDHAFPLLRKYGYTATFFIFTQPIDTYNISYLTWEMVIEMHQAGMEFGSHGYRHFDMRNRDVDFLVYEILGSKEAIEARLHEPVRFFSYPAGRYDGLTIKVLESAHFWGAVTTHWGVEQTHAKRFEWTRLRMRGNDTVADLIKKLDGFN